MSMTSTEPTAAPITTLPPRLADLGFALRRPPGWLVSELPLGAIDFADSGALQLLAVCSAMDGVGVVSLCARPAYDGGTLAEWVEHLVVRLGYAAPELEREQVGGRDAVGCWAQRIEDGTPMRLRLAFFEDGGRLVHVGAMAPEAAFARVAPSLRGVMDSVRLLSPQGSRVPLAPGELAASTFAPPPGAAVLPPAMPEPAPAAALVLTVEGDSLDQEHPLNQNLLQNGRGFVPRIVARDPAARQVRLAPAALVATIDVPDGWHALDDGRRTLIFDAEGTTQLDLVRLPRAGRDDDAILAAIRAELAGGWPMATFLRLQLGTGEVLAVRGAVVDGATIEQAYLLAPLGADDVVRARMTATPETFERGVDLAGSVLASLHVPG